MTFRPGSAIQDIEIAIEAEQRTQQLRVQVLDDGIDLVDPVLQGRAGQDEGIGASERFDRFCRLGLPILDSLRFIQNDDIGSEDPVDIVAIAQNLLVIDENEEGVGFILAQALLPRAGHDGDGPIGEAVDLVLPFGLEGRRQDNQDAPYSSQSAEQFAGGDRLHRFAQSHLVGQQGALAEGQMKHAVALIG